MFDQNQIAPFGSRNENWISGGLPRTAFPLRASHKAWGELAQTSPLSPATNCMRLVGTDCN